MNTKAIEAFKLALETLKKAKPHVLTHGSIAQGEDINFAYGRLEEALDLLKQPPVYVMSENLDGLYEHLKAGGEAFIEFIAEGTTWRDGALIGGVPSVEKSEMVKRWSLLQLKWVAPRSVDNGISTSHHKEPEAWRARALFSNGDTVNIFAETERGATTLAEERFRNVLSRPTITLVPLYTANTKPKPNKRPYTVQPHSAKSLSMFPSVKGPGYEEAQFDDEEAAQEEADKLNVAFLAGRQFAEDAKDPWIVKKVERWDKNDPMDEQPDDDDGLKKAKASLRDVMWSCGDIYGGSPEPEVQAMNYAWEEGFLEGYQNASSSQ